ncbi:MAG: DUF4062 domain-containing protein, partial [Desulfobacteraceae bacterium]
MPIESLEQPSQSRQIRVFISSTFRDMQAERDILIKRIFPQLRKMCEERAVTWTEVDLRWGITDEQKAEGRVLPLCLEEIHRCRPYFIGLLGERYGWIPEPSSIPIELLEAQPWLKQHLQQSVTELEILHGVFSEEPMHGHAYFYFRDPKYVEGIPAEQRQDFAAENDDAARKLAKLKQKIRGARDEQVCELRENFADPEQLGDWILEDLTKLIDRLYAKDQIPDPIEQEAARHEAYARSRRLAFIGREDLLRRLDEYAAEPTAKPLVLTGNSGCGKSALLAEWVARWRKKHPDDLIIQHYIGSTPDSSDWQGLVRRILGELKRAFAITEDIPVQPDKLRTVLQEWTMKSAGLRRHVILVFDALNQLGEDGAARQLGWLPVVFPGDFRVIVSSLPGETLDVLRERRCPEQNVPLFCRDELAPAARAYFESFAKTLPADILAKLESTPAACNALYLRAVLDELRQFGKHQELKAKATDYLRAATLPELYDRILTRWHDDFGKLAEHRDLVRRSLCLIASARFGLSETELLDLLGKNGEPLPRRPWTEFYLAAENALTVRAGLLNLGHDYLRAAVLKRWLGNTDTTHQFRLQLGGYFSEEDTPTDRKLDELPTLLRDTFAWNQLKTLLTDFQTFRRLRSSERWKGELLSLWVPLSEHYDLVEAYQGALVEAEPTLAGNRAITYYETASFLYDAGRYAGAEPLYRQALVIYESSFGKEHTASAATLCKLARLLQARGEYAAAEPFYRQALAVFEQSLGTEHATTLDTLIGLASLLQAKGDYDGAEPLFRKALDVNNRLLGPESLWTVNTIYGLAG